MTPEQLISELQSKIDKLEMELSQAQKDIRDFEILAIEWKKGYSDMERNYRIKLQNAEQVIEELEKELDEYEP